MVNQGAVLLSFDAAYLLAKVVEVHGLQAVLANAWAWPLVPTQHFIVEPATGALPCLPGQCFLNHDHP